jgi:hypothetical protein
MAAHGSSAAPAPSLWTPAAARAGDSPGELADATCALCGIQLSIISLVPDGGHACADVRWYCRDIISCTERWTADMTRRASQPPAPGATAPIPAAEAVPGGRADAGVEPAHGQQAAATQTAAVPAGEAPPSGDAPVLAQGPGPGQVRAGRAGEGRRHPAR